MRRGRNEGLFYEVRDVKNNAVIISSVVVFCSVLSASFATASDIEASAFPVVSTFGRMLVGRGEDVLMKTAARYATFISPTVFLCAAFFLWRSIKNSDKNTSS